MWLYLLAAILGLCLGSFLNVVIYRLPRGLSLVRPRSFCPNCKHTLAWYENLPLLSFLWQRGRCRRCGHPIPWRYPLVELLSAFLACLMLWRFGPGFEAAGFYAFSLLLLAATWIDAEHRIIPDEISLGGLLLGLLFSGVNPLAPPKEAFLGALAGAGGFYLLGEYYYWLRGREGLGGGDYKFLALIGSFLGLKNLLPVMFWASATGLLGAVIGALVQRKPLRGESSLPFGPFLAVGAWIVFFFPQLGTAFFTTIY